MSYFNFRGDVAPQSAAPGATTYGTSAGGERLTAPTGPSAVDSGGGPGDVMIGSSGDNIFYVRDGSDLVQVAGGLAGVKTIVAYMRYALPPNVQNLEITGTYNYAIGNGQSNLIIAHNGSASLYGGPGDDVMVGAGGGTSFLAPTGQGNDVIYGFTAADTIRLIGSNFRSFADVQAAMRQSGSDVVLQIDPSESLTIRSVSTSQLTSSNFLLPLDRSKLGAVTFSDDFNSLQLVANGGQWRPDFGSDPTKQEDYRLPQNGEQQVYTTADFRGTGDHALGYNPFSISNGVLTITAQPIAPQDQAAAFGQGYSSGLLNTRGIFAQKYGYFEIRMAMPMAKGTWPAFWMVPDPNTRGIEADIGENIAIDAQVDHIRGYADGQVPVYAEALKPGDPGGFHTYGMMWTPQTVTYYYDDVAVYQAPTPGAWTAPMYMLVNMAVGGYGGPPDPSAFPASMQVDYVRAYALPDGSSVVQGGGGVGGGGTSGGGTGGGGTGGGGGTPSTTGTDAGDSIMLPAAGGFAQGMAGNDTITVSDARDTMFGGDGNDSIVGGAGFNQVNGNKGDDTIVGRSQVGDWLLGGQGVDRIDATQSTGHNILNGNIGADTIMGGAGGDTLRGGQGDDLITGGAGPDWISGDRGTDSVSGGGGADIFHQSPNGGVSIVTDFNLSEGDRVLLDQGSQYAAAQNGADVVVSVSGDAQVILQHTQLASLTGAWIVVA